MPSLEKIILDIPQNTFKESSQIRRYSGSLLSQVEDITLRANTKLIFQSLLDRFHYTFPNIKNLQVSYQSSTSNADIGLFDFVIPNYSLKQLTVDLTALKFPGDGRFFVIDVELPNERQMFEVPLSLSPLTRVTDDEHLFGFSCGDDDYRIHITISSLTRFVLCVDYK